MSKRNTDIKEAARRAGITYWQIADKLGIAESTLYRKMRHEIEPKEKEKIMDIIKNLTAENESYKNKDIQEAATRAGITYWQIAERLGISEYTLSRKMRHEIEPREKEKIMDIIKELEKGAI